MYQVWTSLGNRMNPGPRFRSLADAVRYIDTHPAGESLGIRNPDGSWHSLPQHREAPALAPKQAPRKHVRLQSFGGRAPRILVVDDHSGSRAALAALLEEERYEVTTAADGAEALASVAADAPDLIISDVNMPHADGFSLVSSLRERAAFTDLPIILISATDDATRRIDGLNMGADDYLPKPLDPEELLARIRVHLRHAQRSREIIARSARDELTGVLNRGGILGVLERERERARRDGTPLAVLMVDVDDFKVINDTYGHAVGDVVLREVANSIVGAVRVNDRVGRFGGDEFFVVAPNTGLSAVEVLVQRIRGAQSGGVEVGNGGPVPISVSVGSAVDNGTMSMEELFNRADAAMYREKRLRKQRPAAHRRQAER